MKIKLIAILASILLISAPAFAAVIDETPGENLGGYDGIASSVAVSFQPFLPALVSTGDVPFEGSFGLGTSRVKSGGNAFGRGALVWPGSTAADLGPVLGVGFGQNELGALIPKWPLQAQANQREGEVITGAPPAIEMRALGQPDRADGESRVADVNVPRLVHIENVASSSVSIVTDGSVTAMGRVALSGVTLLGGYIKAEQIRSVSRTASIGGAGSSSGDVDIEGLTIGGVEVSVTDDGFQVVGVPPDAQDLPGAGGEPFPGQSPEEVVGSVLDLLGARITLFKSISKVKGGSAERMQPGVVISLDNPVGGQGPIPPGRFDIFLASTSSSSLSTLPFGPDALPDVDVSGGGLGGGGADGEPSITIGDGPTVGGSSVTNLGDDLSDAASGSLGAVGLPEGAQNSDYRFDGLPLALVLALLAAAFFVSRFIRNALSSMIAGAAGRSSDDQEE